jgi:hypothetical protein
VTIQGCSEPRKKKEGKEKGWESKGEGRSERRRKERGRCFKLVNLFLLYPT